MLRRIGRGGAGCADHRLERIVCDGDCFGGVLRGGGRVGDDERDRLSDMHHPVGGERRPRRLDDGRAAAPLDRRMRGHAPDARRVQVGGGQNGKNPGSGARRGGVDRRDARMRMGRTYETAEGLVFLSRVVDEPSAAAQKRVVLSPQAPRRHPSNARPIRPSVPTITRHHTNRPKPCLAT